MVVATAMDQDKDKGGSTAQKHSKTVVCPNFMVPNFGPSPLLFVPLLGVIRQMFNQWISSVDPRSHLRHLR